MYPLINIVIDFFKFLILTILILFYHTSVYNIKAIYKNIKKINKSFLVALILGIINAVLGGINISNIAAGELQNILVIIFGIIISIVAGTTAGFTALSYRLTSKAEQFEQDLKSIEDNDCLEMTWTNFARSSKEEKLVEKIIRQINFEILRMNYF